jgi:hypothetical protein
VSIRWDKAEWREQAACLHQDPSLWFPTPATPQQEIDAFALRGITVDPDPSSGRNAIAAKKICVGHATHQDFEDVITGETVTIETKRHEGCPVAEECAMWAVASRQQTGVFGGFGADGKLKWLRSLVWGEEDDPEEPDLFDEITTDTIAEFPETADLSMLIDAIRVEQEELRIEYKLRGPKPKTQRPFQPKTQCRRCGDTIPSGHHPEDRNTPGATCGKAVSYAKGCRCFRCRVANAMRPR